MVEMQGQNAWGKNKKIIEKYVIDELSDYDNMVDEAELEPDYYIDRPVNTIIIIIFNLQPSPIFVPNPEGDIKMIQVNDKDNDLFDFELEAEPIL